VNLFLVTDNGDQINRINKPNLSISISQTTFVDISQIWALTQKAYKTSPYEIKQWVGPITFTSTN